MYPNILKKPQPKMNQNSVFLKKRTSKANCELPMALLRSFISSAQIEFTVKDTIPNIRNAHPMPMDWIIAFVAKLKVMPPSPLPAVATVNASYISTGTSDMNSGSLDVFLSKAFSKHF